MSATRAIKSFVNIVAPPGTRRRTALRRSFALLRRLRRPHTLFIDIFRGPLPTRIDDPYDRAQLNRFLRHAGCRPLRRAGDYGAGSVEEAALWILATLIDQPDARARNPRALTDGSHGAFCHWLCQRLGTQSQGAHHVRAAFDRCFGARVRQGLDEFEDWRRAFPLALTPLGRGGFLRFALESARHALGYSVQDILWFHLANAEDPWQGIGTTYLLTPEWQQRFPDGLTAAGWPELRAWLHESHGFDRDWLSALPAPAFHTAAETALLNALVGRAEGLISPPVAPGINVLGHFRYPCGLGEAAHNTVRALEVAGVPHSKRDVPAGIAHDLPGRDGYLGLEPFDTSLILMAPEPLVEVCYPLSALWKRPGVYRVAVWYWELESVPLEWRRHANLLNEIWAPTRFIHDAMKKVMPIPVIPMLPGIVPPQAAPLAKEAFDLRRDRFTFLFMFDMNSVLERKNPLGLIEAFCQAFPRSDDVQLVIKVSRGEENPADFAQLKAACAGAGPRVQLIDRLMPRDEVYALMHACDCYVSLHRSEGYGLTLAEAMFLGKPTVATAYSGNLDFMTPDTSLLIPYALVPLQRDYAVYRKGSLWADPVIPEAANALRWVFDHPAQAQGMGERGRRHVEDILSLAAYGQRIARRLQELQCEHVLARRVA